MCISKKHSEIYHYTDERGLKGIIRGKNIRASNYKNLNDSVELVYAKDTLRAEIHNVLEELKKDSVNREIKEKYESLQNGKLEKVIYQYMDNSYITSFCGYNYESHEEEAFIRNNGLLSQWRGYCHNGGYILVFNPTSLELMLEKLKHEKKIGGYLFNDAIYKKDDRFYKCLQEFKDKLRKFFSNLTMNVDKELKDIDLLTPILNLISMYKHHAFIEENEVRIFIIRSLSGLPVLSNNLLPINSVNENKYLELNFEFTGNSMIKKIIVGPQKEQKEKESEIKRWLNNENIDIEVSCSEIPFLQQRTGDK